MTLAAVSIDAGPLVLLACMLAAFAAAFALVIGLTTPVESPAMRLARYARVTGRRGSPGAEAEIISFRERILGPVFGALLELAARATPARARRTVASDLTMAGLRMNPTFFLGMK